MRRALLVEAAAGSVAALAPAAFAWAGLSVDAKAPVVEQHTPALAEFGYAQIVVTGERQRAQAENVRSILLGLDEDSLLKPFREMSGKPGPGVSLRNLPSTCAFLPRPPTGRWQMEPGHCV